MRATCASGPPPARQSIDLDHAHVGLTDFRADSLDTGPRDRGVRNKVVRHTGKQRDQTMVRYTNFSAGLGIDPVQQSWSFVVTKVLVAAMALAMVGFWGSVGFLIYSLLAS